jgi:hemin uptake protein HemP
MTDTEMGIKEITQIKKSVRTIDAESLFKGKKEILITYRGEEYQLHLTKSGKLLLTK